MWQYRKDVSIDKLKSLLPKFKTLPLSEGIKKVYNKISNVWVKYIIIKII